MRKINNRKESLSRVTVLRDIKSFLEELGISKRRKSVLNSSLRQGLRDRGTLFLKLVNK